jgi:Peptidase family M48
MALQAVQRYERISAKAYEHPADRAATSALRSVPLLDRVVKRLTDLGHERRFRQVIMGNAVKLGPDQLPDVWGMYTRGNYLLDIEVQPDLFVTNTPEVNALTVGARAPIVVVNSALLASYTPAEIQSVLAHESGHVLSEHYYYTTALVLLSEFMKGALPRSLLLGLPVRAMYLALLEWHRAAELSSDRASALVIGDPLEPCRVLMRLAGGSLPGMNFDAFVAQATAYEQDDDLFGRHTRFWAELNGTHPFAVRRVKELVEWVQAGDYDRIRSGDFARRGHEPPPSAEFNAAVAHYRQRFSYFLERTAGDVQRLTRQFSEWLKRPPVEEAADEDGAPYSW